LFNGEIVFLENNFTILTEIILVQTQCLIITILKQKLRFHLWEK